VLDSDATVRSSTHLVTDFSTTEQVDVTVENVVDVENNHHADSCFVRSADVFPFLNSYFTRWLAQSRMLLPRGTSSWVHVIG
jgi:hypothetical protein